MKKILLIIFVLSPFIGFSQIKQEILLNKYFGADSSGIVITNDTQRVNVTIDPSGNLKFWDKFNGYKTLTALSSAKMVNRYVVGTQGDFAKIKDAITWLNTHMTAPTELLVDAGTHAHADSVHIDLPYTLVIIGTSSNAVTLEAATGLNGKPFFSLYSDVTFHGLTMDGSTLANWGDAKPEDAVRASSGCSYIEYDDVVINKARVGLRMLDSADIWVTNSIFEECSGEGIGVYNASTKQGNLYDIEMNSFVNCTKGIEFQDGDSVQFAIKNNIFESTLDTDTAIYFDGTCTVKQRGTITTITGNDLSHTNNALIGFDFTDIAFSNVYVNGNDNLPNKNPQGFFDVDANAVATAIITQNTWTKANWDAYDASIAVKLDSNGINSISYMPSYKGDLTTEIIFSIQCGNTNQNYEAAIIKNPTWNASMEVTGGSINGIQAFRLVSTGSDQTVVVKAKWFDVVRGDNFSLILRGVNTTVDPTITYLTGIIE